MAVKVFHYLLALYLITLGQFAVAACLCGPAPCNTTIYGPIWIDSDVEYIACETITVERDVTINPQGNLKLEAGLRVVVTDEFKALNNSRFSVLLDANLACDGDADGDSYNQCMDCDDGSTAINPAATEICDGLDNDCNEGTADGMGEHQIGQACDGPDLDECEEGILVCAGAEGLACDDTTPDNPEICGDGLDNDCDGLVDLLDLDCQDCTASGVEPNESAESAHNLGSVTESPPQTSVVAGNLYPLGDRDWYRFHAIDSPGILEDFVVVIRFQSNPGLEFRMRVMKGTSSNVVCTACPDEYVDFGSPGADDSAEYFVEIERDPSKPLTCSDYGLTITNGVDP